MIAIIDSDQPNELTSEPTSRQRSTPAAQRRQLERTVALGEPAAVRADRERDVPEGRHWQAKHAVEQNLPRRTGHQIHAADHLANPHCVVVGHHRELVRIAYVLSSDNEIATDLRWIELDLAKIEVVPGNNPSRNSEPPCERTVAEGTSIICALYRACTGVRRPFVLGVRRLGSAFDIATRAGAGINALTGDKA